ncbi:thiamine pyrophosphate-binding protein [Brevundimonas sp. NIBR11]|uniref:thiamine pyrophosphate-binding protein n=1 Tax=Brevundimonas sp. NIBR11 TaxID=3015999 RepID=UPI0022F01C01|nr:thiamine pyrophosphate-binding protein [Brevundimonas sp. NIBR11]WGM32224.1 Acetolactate synthase large subunit IlvB1 [Brevundimonas sp. NIBR11]
MTQPAGTAARRLVETLAINGVTRVFCVPGESYLAVLDALVDHPEIKVITCRHEAGAANMAEAYGKMTGRPGVCMVTRGPGATHASIGVHTARQDSTPMILFVGQIALTDRGRGAFQEVDYREVFGGLAKWATELESPDRTVEIVERAFATAQQGRMGPVVIALPEDILHEPGGPAPQPTPIIPARAGLDPAFLEELQDWLAKAERPLLVLGGSGWTEEAAAAIGDWSERLGLPVALSFRRKDILSNDRSNYAGDLGLGCNPELMKRAKDADLLIALGARLGENPTQGYTLFTRDETAHKLVHIHPGPEELGRVWRPLISAVADNSLAALALSTLEPGRTWHDAAKAAHDHYQAFSTPVSVTGAVNMSECMAHLGEVLPPTAIVTNGAGNFAAWLHRFYRHRACRTQLAPTSGAMGYGYPAAIAAKSLQPGREVICVAGDGDFMMTGQELATAVQHGINTIVILVDNGTYGTIRMHQEGHYPRRVIATDLKNPDFVKYAEAFGAFAIRCETTADFPAALQAARDAAKDRPALVHLITSAEDIAPNRTITGLRNK